MHNSRSIVFAVVIVWLTAACTAANGDSVLGVREVSQPLPVLAGEDLHGQSLSTEDFAGQVLVINAWATWCDPCEEEQPALVRVARRYDDDGVRFVGIDHQDQSAAALEWVRAYDVPYPSFSDRAGGFAAKLGYFGLPDTYIVDESGTIRFVITGPTTEGQLSGLLDRVIAEGSQARASSATAANSVAR
jgi:DsbE subfamily thiol:disulfide oxidoreductase